MITLTTPATINSVLGGSALVNYDHLVLSPITHDPTNLTISGTLRLTSSANTSMQVIRGSFIIDASKGTVEVEVQQLDFYRRVLLSPTQISAALTLITNAQNAVETGLIGLAVVAGTQSPGA